MLQVSDDGVGFAAETAQSGLAEKRHFGLLGMQERATLLGGRLSIESRPGGGTTIVAVVPAPAQESSPG